MVPISSIYKQLQAVKLSGLTFLAYPIYMRSFPNAP